MDSYRGFFSPKKSSLNVLLLYVQPKLSSSTSSKRGIDLLYFIGTISFFANSEI